MEKITYFCDNQEGHHASIREIKGDVLEDDLAKLGWIEATILTDAIRIRKITADCKDRWTLHFCCPRCCLPWVQKALEGDLVNHGGKQC